MVIFQKYRYNGRWGWMRKKQKVSVELSMWCESEEMEPTDDRIQQRQRRIVFSQSQSNELHRFHHAKIRTSQRTIFAISLPSVLSICALIFTIKRIFPLSIHKSCVLCAELCYSSVHYTVKFPRVPLHPSWIFCGLHFAIFVVDMSINFSSPKNVALQTMFRTISSFILEDLESASRRYH